MGSRFSFALIVILSLVCATAAAQEKVTIGIMEFTGKAGFKQDRADVLADVMSERISRMGNVKVINRSDIFAMLSLEHRKRIADCTDDTCVLEEIGGALGMEWMVIGNVSRFENIHLLNLKLLDIRNADVPSRVSRRIEGGDLALLDGLLEATQELFEKAADRIQLVPTVTVASMRIQLLEESPSAVSVYTRSDILSSGAIDLTDFLRRVPGFDIYRLKPAWSLVGSRSMTSMSNNLILPIIDGREALLEFTGFTLWGGLTIDLEEIERLEVIRGPGSALYGANAFAGVLSITTVSRKAGSQGDVFLRTGEVGHQRIFGRIRGRNKLGGGSLSYGAGIGVDEKASSSDFQDKTAGVRSHGYLIYSKINEMELALHAGFAMGDSVFFHNVGDWRISNSLINWFMTKGDFTLASNVELKSQIYYSSMTTDQFYRARVSAYNIWIADIPNNSPQSNSLDAKCQLDWQIVDNLLIISGANLRYTTVDWEKIFLSHYDEVRGAGFLQVQWRPWHELQLTGGLRLDLNTLTDTALSPRVVAVLSPWKRHSFRLGYGLAFRKPSAYETKTQPRVEVFNPATPEIVEKAKTQFGNENLINEKVHSIEAGWRARLLDGRLQASVDLFFNLYRDTINFSIDIPYRMGLPYIMDSTFRFDNEGVEANAFGGEAELRWWVHEDWSLWCNFGLRHVANKDSGDRMPSEPIVRVNLGGRYAPEYGITADVTFHYVSEYEMPLIDPDNVFENPKPVGLGNNLLMVGRLGYKMVSGKSRLLEAGISIVTPLGKTFREYPGVPIPQWSRLKHMSDWGGEMLTRIVTFYLRGSL